METAQAKYQIKQDAQQNVNSHREPTNETVSHKVAIPNSVRKERRKEWWNKKKKEKLESSEDSKIKQKASPVVSDEGVGEKNNHGSEPHRPQLRNRDTLTKPDSLKYEPDFNRGFHNKIMQNLYTDSKKKKSKGSKELNESLTKPIKRKPTSPLAANEPENAKKTKNVDVNEVFDSYKFSMTLINGEVDVSKNAAGKDSKNKYVLFVGNLPYDITKEQLEEHFRKTGGIKSIRIPKAKGTDKGRGFAYMEFDGRISHGIALRLHQTTLGGRKINVEFTSIGGGKSETRKEKLMLKNKKRKKMKMQ